MKKVLLWLFFLVHIWTAYGFEQQWFGTYNELDGSISATCKQQCVAVGPLFVGNDFVKVEGSVQWQWTIIVWFMVQNQIFTFLQEQITGKKDISLSGDIASMPQANTIPADATIVLLVQGNMELSSVSFEVWSRWMFEKVSAWMKSASQYAPYSPRTINFLEAPMWNGKYITQSFFYRLLVLVAICIILFYIVDKKNKKNVLLTWWIIIAFFWVLVDIFVSIQEKHLYKQIVHSTPLQQTRYGAQPTEIQYLDYVKQIFPAWSNVYIYAAYPYDFELQYRLYPHARIGTTWNSSYIIWYNPSIHSIGNLSGTDLINTMTFHWFIAAIGTWLIHDCHLGKWSYRCPPAGMHRSNRRKNS